MDRKRRRPRHDVIDPSTEALVSEITLGTTADVDKAVSQEMRAPIGPVVNKAQFDKIQDLIQSAIDEGATLVTGGTGRPYGRYGLADVMEVKTVVGAPG